MVAFKYWLCVTLGISKILRKVSVFLIVIFRHEGPTLANGFCIHLVLNLEKVEQALAAQRHC